MTTTQRDQEVLAEVLAPQIAALEPLTQFPNWRETFAAEAARWQRVGNGRPAGSEEQREAFSWALAHEMILAREEA